jgi:formylglycine-generating enzyme required for sulfatase activity
MHGGVWGGDGRSINGRPPTRCMVWEWCWDWYDAYVPGAQTDPTGSVAGSVRVLRGGSWYDFGQYLRSAYRDYGYPSDGDDDLGFRLVRP